MNRSLLLGTEKENEDSSDLYSSKDENWNDHFLNQSQQDLLFGDNLEIENPSLKYFTSTVCLLKDEIIEVKDLTFDFKRVMTFFFSNIANGLQTEIDSKIKVMEQLQAAHQQYEALKNEYSHFTAESLKMKNDFDVDLSRLKKKTFVQKKRNKELSKENESLTQELNSTRQINKELIEKMPQNFSESERLFRDSQKVVVSKLDDIFKENKQLSKQIEDSKAENKELLLALISERERSGLLQKQLNEVNEQRTQFLEKPQNTMITLQSSENSMAKSQLTPQSKQFAPNETSDFETILKEQLSFLHDKLIKEQEDFTEEIQRMTSMHVSLEEKLSKVYEELKHQKRKNRQLYNALDYERQKRLINENLQLNKDSLNDSESSSQFENDDTLFIQEKQKDSEEIEEITNSLRSQKKQHTVQTESSLSSNRIEREAENETLKEKVSYLEDQLWLYQDLIEQKNSHLSEIESLISLTEKELSYLRMANVNLEAEKARLITEAQEFQSVALVLQTKLENIEANSSQKRNINHEQWESDQEKINGTEIVQLGELSLEKLKNAERVIYSLSSQLSELTKKNELQKVEIQRLIKENSYTKRKVMKRLKAEMSNIDDFKEQYTQIEQENEILRNNDIQTEQLIENFGLIDSQLEQAKVVIDDLQKELQDVNSKNKSLQQENSEILNKHLQLCTIVSSLESQLKDNKQHVLELNLLLNQSLKEKSITENENLSQVFSRSKKTFNRKEIEKEELDIVAQMCREKELKRKEKT